MTQDHATGRTARALAPLAAILGAGLVLRLLFLGSSGFHNDVGAFESWTLTLRDGAPWQFYAKAGFADYPPGYFVVLWVLAKIYAVFPGAADAAHGYPLLRALVKLPAVLMDLVDAAVTYAIVLRYAERRVALLGAALVALNPAAIYVSAYWGQIDSVAWGLVLVALALVTSADADPRKTVPRITWAWLAFGFAILIKPQPLVVGAILIAYPFATGDAAVRARRLLGSTAGVVAAFGLAGAISLVFHPAADVFGWLLARYAFGSGVYAYNTVNAFNLYAVRQPFWVPDNVPLSIFGVAAGSLAVWGVGLVVTATLLIAWRYVQTCGSRALLEGAMLVALAFFVLATRMHERYVYGAFLLSMPLIAFGRRGLWAALVLSVTMYLNLAYSLAYQTVMEAKTPGVDATDLWPLVSHPAALANVALLAVLVYFYVSDTSAAADGVEREGSWSRLGTAFGAAAVRARTWFDAREGTVAMTRLDVLLAGAFTLASFVLCVAWIGFPAEKIFDEIYYARAGEEYLRHVDHDGLGTFEFTHPPLTKLLITLSMLLFGGLHGLGDTATGWRFLNVVVGALMVGLTYAFAKRLTRSTPFAALAAGMLMLDGFHYVQSRIATPEITVAFLSLLTLYAFYRLWLAGQVARRAPLGRRAVVALAATAAIGAVVALAVAVWIVPARSGPIVVGTGYTGWAQAVAAGWIVVTFWLIGRTLVAPRFADRTAAVVSYADGTRVETAADGTVRTEPLDGAPFGTTPDGLTRTADGAGTLTYATPAATATYAADATATVRGAAKAHVGDADEIIRGGDARVWWFVLPVCAALLADSKWNGLLDFFVIGALVALVNAQRWFRVPAVLGNPFGAPLDVVGAALVAVGGIVYVVSYAPYFALGHGFVDVVSMQHQMYGYHAHLVATHPYASVWWQWPLLDRPILYYTNYSHIAPPGAPDCCVSTIRALPNPIVWWAGLVSVPAIAWLGYRERNKGYLLLVTAYLFQWLPWIGSPRLSFEYHFFPNLAIIVLANAIALQRLWQWGRATGRDWARYTVWAYTAAVVVAFVYFFPIVSGYPITWAAYQARMWNPHWI